MQVCKTAYIAAFSPMTCVAAFALRMPGPLQECPCFFSCLIYLTTSLNNRKVTLSDLERNKAGDGGRVGLTYNKNGCPWKSAMRQAC